MDDEHILDGGHQAVRQGAATKRSGNRRTDGTRTWWACAVLLPLLLFVSRAGGLLPVEAAMFREVMSLLQFAMFFSACFLLVALPFGLLMLAFGAITKKERRRCCSIGAACICFVLLWLGAMRASHWCRDWRFTQAGVRGEPIIAALAAYKERNGDYPEELNDLTPTYIESIPFTGLALYPKYDYTKYKNNQLLDAGGYELRIWCGVGLTDFSKFMYQPAEDYPERICRNRVTRLGRWAYVQD